MKTLGTIRMLIEGLFGPTGSLLGPIEASRVSTWGLCGPPGNASGLGGPRAASAVALSSDVSGYDKVAFLNLPTCSSEGKCFVVADRHSCHCRPRGEPAPPARTSKYIIPANVNFT